MLRIQVSKLKRKLKPPQTQRKSTLPLIIGEGKSGILFRAIFIVPSNIYSLLFIFIFQLNALTKKTRVLITTLPLVPFDYAEMNVQ